MTPVGRPLTLRMSLS